MDHNLCGIKRFQTEIQVHNFVADSPKIPGIGQPGFIAKKLCSELGNVQLKIVPTNFELYRELGIV